MSDQDFSLNEVAIVRCRELFQTIRTFLVCGFVVLIFYFIGDTLKVISLTSPQHISALANLAKEFHLGTISGWGLAGGVGVAYWKERKGKKRAIREKSRMQRVLEAQDPERSSSGLTETGDTPEE